MAGVLGKKQPFSKCSYQARLKKGDRVQIFTKLLEYPEIVIGGNKAGLINTAGNFRLSGKELSYQLNDCGARAIIMKSLISMKT